MWIKKEKTEEFISRLSSISNDLENVMTEFREYIGSANVTSVSFDIYSDFDNGFVAKFSTGSFDEFAETLNADVSYEKADNGKVHGKFVLNGIEVGGVSHKEV